MNSLLRAAYTTALALGITISTFAQSYGVRAELHAENIGVLTNVSGETTDLTGFNTYRLYATTVNSADFVSAVYGNSESPLSINTTTSYFHSSFASLTSAGSNPLLFSVYPDVAYDSYITIGLTGPADATAGEADPQMATSPSQNFGAIFDPGAGAAGANLVIDDLVGGTWFVLNTAVNGIAGADLEVPIGQFTTDGDFSGTVNVQVFENGAGGTTLFNTDTFEYDEGCATDADDDGICDDEDDCVGTLDACEVCNGPGAIYDCGCTGIPAGACNCAGDVDDALGVCGGDCAADADGDGICDDEDDCVGTLDACEVCNGPGAIYDCGCTDMPAGDCDCDGNVDDAIGVCGGSCVADADGDGICDDEDDCVGTLDACEVCNGPGAIYDCGCADIPAGDCDCAGNVDDALGVCGGSCAADADGDGICDDEDDCVGTLDACEVCNGPGAIYDCGCTDIPAGDCDCDGNVDDALGVCGGDCAADTNDNGICDDEEDCLGTVDACGVCDGPGAIYDCGCADIPAGDCDCDGNQLDALDVCGGDCAADADGDGICDDEDDCVGSLDACEVCNGPGAIYDCGCTDIPAGDCDCDGNQLDALDVCGGDCAADADGDGICDDEDDCVGSLDACEVCNGPGAIYDCGCTEIPAGDCDCDGNVDDAIGVCGGDCAADTNDNGICDDEEDCLGTVDACGVCDGPGAIYDCGCADIPAGDCDCDGNVDDALGVCGGDCAADANDNGVCDSEETIGCTDSDACNYDPDAIDGPVGSDEEACMELEVFAEHTEGDLAGMTTYRLYFHPSPDTDFVTSVYGNSEEPLSVTTTTSFYQNTYGGLTAASVNPLLVESFPDLEYDSYVTIGLTGPADAVAGENDASTIASPSQNWGLGFDPGGGAAGGDLIINDEVGGAYYIFNGDANGYADEDGRVLLGQFTTDGEIGGTVNVQVLPGPSGVFDVYTLPVATTCSGGDLCIYPDENYDCNGDCINDADADGICDEDEVPGCTDSDACNYSEDATDDDGSCAVLDECGDCGGDGIPAGDCDCYGNVDDAIGVCGGDCASDTNDNGICDDEEDCLGTVDACGVCDGPGAIYDCGCADIPAGDCDCDGNQLDALDVCGGDCAADANDNGVCDSEETIGCTDPDACNYDPDAIDGPVGSDAEACMELEVFAEHTEGDLAGMTTYRLYFHPSPDTDFVTSVYGNSEEPLSVTTTTSFYQNAFGGLTAASVNPLLVESFPDLEYDSYVTIGLTGPADAFSGENDASTIASPSQNWGLGFDPGGGAAGGDLIINDEVGGAYYIFNGDANGYADEDGRVLLGQFTTDGEIGGTVNVQVLPGPSGVFDVYTLPVATTCSGGDLCIYPDENYDCNGDCINDADADGICDEDEVPGCTDSDACNYSEDATDDDGSCAVLDECGDCGGDGIPAGDCDCYGNVDDAIGVCGGDCAADTNDNGICDDEEDCLGTVDACGVCDGPGAIYDCGCADIPAGDCDCDGNVDDALGVCGGDCAADENNNGVCDSEETIGCTDPDACNYDPDAIDGPVGSDAEACMELEVFAEHTEGDLAGMTTYRLYFHPSPDTDFVTSVYGNSEEPLSVTTTTSFYQNAFGGLTAASVNPLLVESFPDLEYDSYVTIGLTGPADAFSGENDASTIASPSQNWGLGFDPGGGAAGGDLIINDEVGGAYYIFNGDANGYADEDGRVLLGQFTTDGEIGGTVNVQVLPGPSGVFDVYTLPVATTCSGGDLCIYPDENYDCNGDCINDADADGICDEDEVPGCTDSDACNYSEDATDDDGSCAVLDECGDCGGDGIPAGDCDCYGNVDDAIGVCGGDCAADTNDNGICDDEEDCLGTVDACGVCDGPGAIYDCGCADIPAGDCDCDGNVDDALGVCGGDCAADENNNGVCDSEETIGCTDPDACNYDPDAIDGPVGSDAEACMELEVFAEHTEGDLAGMTTYRLYFHPSPDTDFVTSVYGNSEEPLSVTTTTSFYQNAFGGLTAASVNPLLVESFPDLEYDSYVTIGLTGPADAFSGENDASTIASPSQNWGLGFDPGGGAAGGDLIINDEVGGAYYIFNGDANGYADEDGRVLLGQFTTDGEIGGTVNVQVLPGPSGVFDVYTLPVATTCSGGDLCIYPDENYDCNGDCINDADADGICDEDEVPGCTDSDACNYSEDATDDDGSCILMDACGVCDGPGAIYDCGCTDMPAGDCDCDGNQEDAVGDCGGDCEEDLDQDDICDDIDDCVMNPVCEGLDDDCDGICNGDEVAGCTDSDACNYNDLATDDDDSCLYLDAVGECGGDCAEDTDGDGVCDTDESAGCTISSACNYDADATDEDGSCEFTSCRGCTDPDAWNYDDEATIDDGSCIFVGCTDPDASNYDDQAMINDGSCLYPGCTDPFSCNYDADANDDDGSCEYESCAGCMYSIACNYDPDATISDESCDFFSCRGCTDPDAVNYDEDATIDNGSCIYTGCTDPDAANYNDEADIEDGSCLYGGCLMTYACNFDPDADVEDGSCEFESCAGCMITFACNYDPDAMIQNDSMCDFYTCCGDPDAINYDPDVASFLTFGCIYDDDMPVPSGMPSPLCDLPFACNFMEEGPCEFSSCAGCMDPTGCNYVEGATIEITCIYAVDIYDVDYVNCDGDCLNDANGDGVCDEEEVAGCTSPLYCNYDPAATADDGSCELVSCGGCMDSVACNFDASATLSDGSCDYTACAGCTNVTACNFNASSSMDDGSCTYPADSTVDCDGNCINDVNTNGLCDENEITGCTDPLACNLDIAATLDDGSCWYADTGFDCNGDPIGGSGDSFCGEGTAWDADLQMCVGDLGCQMDFNGDGEVGAADLINFLTQFDTSCE